MERKEFKSTVFNHLSNVLKALSNPYRLEIVETLSQGELSVEAIAACTGISIANASQHLQVLKNNKLIKSRKAGHFVIYSLVNYQFLTMYRHFTQYASDEFAELKLLIHQHREEFGTHESVSAEELALLANEKDILLLDLRSKGEFEQGHIPGAVSIPFDLLPERLNGFSSAVEVIVYCRGPFCFLADEAVKLLRENGIHARRLSSGYPEWKAKQIC